MNDQNTRILALVLNILFPGVGSLIAGNQKNGIWQLVLYFGGWIFFWLLIWVLIGVLGLFAVAAGWIWALIDGIKIYQGKI